jgi:hypothetical protein
MGESLERSDPSEAKIIKEISTSIAEEKRGREMLNQSKWRRKFLR